MTAQAQLLLSELDKLAIRAETPCRVDLAGGTLDIHPLCVFEAPTLTINVAIDILNRVDLKVRTDGRIVIRSEDRGVQVRYKTLKELVESEAETPVDLIVEAVRFWQPPTGFELTTHGEAPHGSGLGASSSLLVAVLGAFAAMFGGRFGRQEVPDNTRLVQRAQAIEAKHLKVPTGSQDHIAALLGGELAIQYDGDGPYVEELTLAASMRAFLESHLLVAFSGVEHTSAAPNWQVLRRYIDGDQATRERLRRLKKIAEEMLEALRDGRRERVVSLLGEDWAVRRELADGVTTPELDALIDAVKEAGASAVKPCGAGGGGSLAMLAPPDKHDAIVAVIEARGGRRLPCRPTPNGIRVARIAAEPEEEAEAGEKPKGPQITVIEGGKAKGAAPAAAPEAPASDAPAPASSGGEAAADAAPPPPAAIPAEPEGSDAADGAAE